MAVGIKKRTSYGISMALFPILFQYATFIPSFTIGDLFFLITLVLMIASVKPVKIEKSIAVLTLYILLLTLSCLVSNTLERPTTSLRYIVYLLGIMYLPNVEGYENSICRVFDIAGKLAIILLIAQYFALNVFGLVVPGVLTFLPLTDSSLLGYDDMVYSTASGRCMSLFGEPSHFAIYAVLYLFYKLFECHNITRRAMFWAVMTSVAIIMSASFTGVFSMVAVWGFKILQLIKSRKISIRYIILIAIVFALLIWIMLSTSAGNYITDQDIYERQSMGRFAGFQYIYEMSLDSINFWFGNGMNDIGKLEYLSGWPRLFFYYGLLGSSLYVICIISCARRKTVSVYLVLLIGILMVGTEMNFGCFFMSYMLYVFLFRKKTFI